MQNRKTSALGYLERRPRRICHVAGPSRIAEVGFQGAGVWSRFSASRTDTLWNYERLLRIYEAGPPDPRRDSIVRRLRETLDRLKTL